MYRIVVLTKSEAQAAFFTEQVSQFCAECGRFPVVETFCNQEQFFESAGKTPPTNAVIALPGVDGLNAVEHLRRLCRNTRIIWCSDLDFSLHAFRLRADYFLLEPVTKAAFQQGLCAWLKEKNSVAQLRPNYTETNKEDYS